MRLRSDELRLSRSPPQLTTPLEGDTSVDRMPSMVDLPAPLGPSTAATWAGRKERETSVKARCRP